MMNPETKICLTLLLVLVVGLALIAYGLGAVSKLAAVGTGIALVMVSTSLFAVIWRGRP